MSSATGGRGSSEIGNLIKGIVVGLLIVLVLAPFIGFLAVIPACLAIVKVLSANTESGKHTNKQKKERSNMNTLPVPIGHSAMGHYYDPQLNSSWPNVSPIVVDAKAVIAHASPELAARAIERTSLDRTLENIAMPVAHEFAKQGKGTRGGIRRTRGFFGGDGIEFFVEPIDPHR